MTLEIKLNQKLAEMVAGGKMISSLEIATLDFAIDAEYHPFNRDHAENYKNQEHHRSCLFCPTKLTVDLHYVKETNKWYIGAGNTRKFSLLKAIEAVGAEGMDPRFFTNNMQANCMIFDSMLESSRAVRNAGGPGVGWSVPELDRKARELSTLMEDNEMFEKNFFKSSFLPPERKDMEASYAKYRKELTVIFTTLEELRLSGVDFRAPRSKAGEEFGVEHLKPLSAGAVRGWMQALSAGADEEKVVSLIKHMVTKTLSDDTTRRIYKTILRIRAANADKLSGEGPITSIATTIVNELVD